MTLMSLIPADRRLSINPGSVSPSGGRETSQAMKDSREMGLVAKAAFRGDFGQRFPAR